MEENIQHGRGGGSLCDRGWINIKSRGKEGEMKNVLMRGQGTKGELIMFPAVECDVNIPALK